MKKSVNINTLNELNSYGIGANINAIESFLVDYRQASMVSEISMYNKLLELKDTLYMIDKSSAVFGTVVELKEQDIEPEYDSMLQDYTYENILGYDTNYRPWADKYLYGAYYKNETISKENNAILNYAKALKNFDLVAIENIHGLRVKLTYYGSILIRANLVNMRKRSTYDVSKGVKYISILDYIGSNKTVLETVEDFDKNKVTEVYGVLTLNEKDKRNDNIRIPVELYVLNNIRLNIGANSLRFIALDTYTNNEDTVYKNYWQKLEYLDRLGFTTPIHIKMKEVDVQNINQVIDGFGRHLHNNRTGHSIYGYNIIFDRDIKYYRDKGTEEENEETQINELIYFKYVDSDCDPEQVFCGKFKGIVMDNMVDDVDTLYVKITDTLCNDILKINKVLVDDISALDSYDLSDGCDIYFKVFHGKGILYSIADEKEEKSFEDEFGYL